MVSATVKNFLESTISNSSKPIKFAHVIEITKARNTFTNARNYLAL